MNLPFITADEIRRTLSPVQAIKALEQRILTDPPLADRPNRTFIPVHAGELLVMPDESQSAVGLKLLSIARANPSRALPAIQGVYVLMDAETLTPRALLDAAELTCVRTSAVSMLAVTHLHPARNPNVVVIGSGPQALAHCRAATAVEPGSIAVLARNETLRERLIAQANDEQIEVITATGDSLESADVILCCTTSREPVIGVSDVKPDVIIVAIGSHEPTARELAADLFVDSFVVVESVDNARREAGDIILAEADLKRDVISADLEQLLVSGPAPSTGRRIFKSVGDAWEDLTIAEAITNRLT